MSLFCGKSSTSTEPEEGSAVTTTCSCSVGAGSYSGVYEVSPCRRNLSRKPNAKHRHFHTGVKSILFHPFPGPVQLRPTESHPECNTHLTAHLLVGLPIWTSMASQAPDMYLTTLKDARPAWLECELHSFFLVREREKKKVCLNSHLFRGLEGLLFLSSLTWKC